MLPPQHISANPNSQSISGLERPATTFLSYAREDAEEVRYLKQQLNVRGVRAWRDVTDLVVGGSTKDEIAIAIEEESDAFVIYITQECLASDFIWSVEVPAALKRWERDHAFNIIPIFRGATVAEVQQFCAARSLRSLTDFNGVSLPDSITSGTKSFNHELGIVAERILKATLGLRLRRVGADRDRKYEPCVYLQTFNFEPPAESLDLDLDWTKLFKSKDEVPTDEEWEEFLFPALRDVKNVLSTKTPSRRLHVFVQAILPAAFALGYALPESAYFTLHLEGRHGTWSTGETPSDPLPLRLLNYPRSGDEHIAVVEIAISRATALGVIRSLPTLGLSFKHHIRFELPDGPDRISGVKDASQALAISLQIGRELRRLCDREGVSQIHLFASLPAALAVIVGYQFNALGAITLYHYVQSDGQYIRVCTLGK
jgi:SMODS-associated and fused to various effectors sensor domain/TIR domain